jgi:hypothetical protein
MGSAYATGSRAPACRARRHPSRARTSSTPADIVAHTVREGCKGFCALPRRAGAMHARRSRAGSRAWAILASCASVLVAAGCGGGARQDQHEASASYAVKVLRARFPTAQSIAKQTSMVLQVQNTGAQAVPNLAITIDSFDYASGYPELADNKRPVWAIERGAGGIAPRPVESEEVDQPGAGQTAYVNTWAFGSLAPGKTRTLTWNVVPVVSGHYTVHYTVAAGLAGKAKARSSGGGLVDGQFAVDIAPAPKPTHVNPDTGRVEVGQFPISP